MNVGDNVVWRFLDKKLFHQGKIIRFLGEANALVEISSLQLDSEGFLREDRASQIIKQSEIEIYVI